MDINGDGSADAIQSFHLEDINRDGLADLVPNVRSDSVPVEYVLINTGHTSVDGDGNIVPVWKPEALGAFPGHDELPRGTRVLGDIDGDGMYDPLTFYQFSTFIDVISDLVLANPTVALATGTGYGSAPAGFLDAITTYGPDPSVTTFPTSERPNHLMNMADINGDGLADLIVNHPDGGQLLVNRGTSWVDLNGATTRQTTAGLNGIPVMPTEDDKLAAVGAAFVDLDG